MSGSQSRNDVSLSEATEPETEVLYSEDMKAHIDHFNHHANEIAESIDRLVAGTPSDPRRQEPNAHAAAAFRRTCSVGRVAEALCRQTGEVSIDRDRSAVFHVEL